MIGYDKKSFIILGALGAVGCFSAIVWREYVSFADADALLVVCWVLMAALMARGVDTSRDGRLALVAFFGGAFIESWGTRAGLWTYFTREEPPLFILPAWPAAALATERIARSAEVVFARVQVPWRALYAIAMVVFVVVLVRNGAPGYEHPLTLAAGALVLLTIFTGDDRRADLARFVAGSLLGYLLERWGTTSACWTYWTGGTPPLWSVLSHGFATIAFARGAALSRSLGVALLDWRALQKSLAWRR